MKWIRRAAQRTDKFEFFKFVNSFTNFKTSVNLKKEIEWLAKLL